MPFEKCMSIKTVMPHFNKKWFIAGGWAIDLFLGIETWLKQAIKIHEPKHEWLQLLG